MIVRKQPAGSFQFTREDEDLMSTVGERLAASGLELERSAGPVDYYRITKSNSGRPQWIVARQVDGLYQLFSGNLDMLRTGTGLRDVLPPDWLAPRG